MSTPPAGRDQRRQELSRLSRRRLATIHHQGAGCLMTMSELMRWNHEDLEAAILDSEFGPRDQTPIDQPEADQ